MPVSTAELPHPPIRAVGLTVSFAASLRDTGSNGNVGRQTRWVRSVKLDFQKQMPNARYDILKA